jgi:hypothetical protein
MRPTPEQIKEARADAEKLLVGEFVAKPSDAIRTLIAATEPATDEEIIARYNAFLERKGFQDAGHVIWFADGIEAFLGRVRKPRTCACGKCPVQS